MFNDFSHTKIRPRKYYILRGKYFCLGKKNPHCKSYVIRPTYHLPHGKGNEILNIFPRSCKGFMECWKGGNLWVEGDGLNLPQEGLDISIKTASHKRGPRNFTNWISKHTLFHTLSMHPLTATLPVHPNSMNNNAK